MLAYRLLILQLQLPVQLLSYIANSMYIEGTNYSAVLVKVRLS